MKAPQEWGFTNLLEILRLYADRYCRFVNQLQFFSSTRIAGMDDAKGVALLDQLIAGILPSLKDLQAECDTVGLEATRDEIDHVLITWERYHDRDVLGKQCSELAPILEREFKRRVCLILSRSSQVLYESPTISWEAIIAAFPDIQDDVEEMNKCKAFGRDAASVFHALLVVEHGLIQLGIAMRVTDPKQGWDATCKVLEKVMKDGRALAPKHIQKHFAFYELVNKDIQSMKMAWRNKVSHAANKLVVITSDFKPQVAEKIITACHGFMLLLATEGPRKIAAKK